MDTIQTSDSAVQSEIAAFVSGLCFCFGLR